LFWYCKRVVKVVKFIVAFLLIAYNYAMQLNKLKLPLIAAIIVGVISLFGWFQYSRLQDLKIKTLYYTENNFNRLYYEVRYELLKESYMGGFDTLPKLTEDVINNPQSAELLDIAQKLKRENSLSHQVFLGLLKLPGHSIDLYYLDSTFIPAQITLEDTLVINALVAFRDLLPTGDSYGEDYSLQLTDQKILLTEPLLLQKNNQVNSSFQKYSVNMSFRKIPSILPSGCEIMPWINIYMVLPSKY
jgi:hypothetical protein